MSLCTMQLQIAFSIMHDSLQARSGMGSDAKSLPSHTSFELTLIWANFIRHLQPMNTPLASPSQVCIIEWANIKVNGESVPHLVYGWPGKGSSITVCLHFIGLPHFHISIVPTLEQVNIHVNIFHSSQCWPILTSSYNKRNLVALTTYMVISKMIDGVLCGDYLFGRHVTWTMDSNPLINLVLHVYNRLTYLTTYMTNACISAHAIGRLVISLFNQRTFASAKFVQRLHLLPYDLQFCHCKV